MPPWSGRQVLAGVPHLCVGGRGKGRRGAGLRAVPAAPWPQRSARFRGRRKTLQAGAFVLHCPMQTAEPVRRSCPRGRSRRGRTRLPGCRQGPLSARARPFANARRDRAGGGRLRRGLTLAAPGQTQTRQPGRRSGKGVGPATAWAVAGSGAHGVPRPPAPTEARFPLSRLSGVSARSRGESEFTPKLADGAGRGRGVWPGGGRGRRDGWPRPGCGQPGPSPRAPPPGAQQRPRPGNPGNPHSGRLHAFIYWPRWEEMRFSNGLARRKALRFVGAKGGRPPPSPSRVAK